MHFIKIIFLIFIKSDKTGRENLKLAKSTLLKDQSHSPTTIHEKLDKSSTKTSEVFTNFESNNDDVQKNQKLEDKVTSETLLLNDGSIYQGEIYKGMKCGYGVQSNREMTFKYEGEWKDNLKCGQGKN
jgi:hypothetical protein